MRNASHSFDDGTTWYLNPRDLTITCDGAGGSAAAGAWTFSSETALVAAWHQVLTH